MSTKTKTYTQWRKYYVQAIADRAYNQDLIDSRRNFRMDLQAADCHIGLRLPDLLDAPNFDFTHDVIGIVNNINRTTARLDNFFLPRYAAPKRPSSLPDFPSWFVPSTQENPITP